MPVAEQCFLAGRSIEWEARDVIRGLRLLNVGWRFLAAATAKQRHRTSSEVVLDSMNIMIGPHAKSLDPESCVFSDKDEMFAMGNASQGWIGGWRRDGVEKINGEDRFLCPKYTA